MQHRFSVFLTHKVIQAKKNGKREDYNSIVRGILEDDLPEMTRLDAVHKGIEDFYRNSVDGYGFAAIEQEVAFHRVFVRRKIN